ncbi:MAG TPA: 3-hydroxyacyl-CoA dehydrogenase NAD-binding domain-containing protein [Chthoniobacteraceae bacterium]|nr:3-hydroxyacyl-CoA dehydrogenase NAD-binding domain-containing protein [Chthoniobacteraceae bacterium]
MQTIRVERSPDDMVVLTFDRPHSGANVFDRETLELLETQLDEIGRTGAPGLVLQSAKPAIFVAGADLFSIQSMSEAELLEFIALGQRAFSKIAALRIPTVAAVHGAALGGGLELCLACDWRVASPDRATKFGLPETKLGILPAWGGSTRLPRVIGLRKALDAILGGKTFNARKALAIGLIDDIAPRAYLLDTARSYLARGKRHRRSAGRPLIPALIAKGLAPKFHRVLHKKTHGHYPALDRALDVVLGAASASNEEKGLALERAAIGELISLEPTKNLLRLFVLQERAKKLRVSPDANGAPRTHIARAGVIGAGVMGSGIAQGLSARGVEMRLHDINAERVASGMARSARLYDEAVKRRILSPNEARRGLDRIAPIAGEMRFGRSQFVIEAASEKMAVKQQIFARLDEITEPATILATNTSALSIETLASCTRHPARVIGMHFFNPVHRMQLVEVIAAPATATATVDATLAFVQQIGKLPLLVRDSPGFLVNRVLVPYLIEAGHLFESGMDAMVIDETMLNFGMPMGPLRLIDEVGVDIAADVARTLAAAFPDHIKVPPLLAEMERRGLLGRKSGRGFFEYKKKRTPTPCKEAEQLRSSRPSATREGDLEPRLVLLMVNEAARCLDEKVVEAPADADFGMVTGTGFAPFRGGPLRYADALGTQKVVDQLQRLADAGSGHHAPCARLREMRGGKFYDD